MLSHLFSPFRLHDSKRHFPKHDPQHSAGTLCILFIAVISGLGSPNLCNSLQENPEAERLFVQAMADYQRGKFRSAQERLEQILTLPHNQRYSSALLLLGKTHYKLHAFDVAIMSAERLLREFPTSTYMDDGHYLLGNCHEGQGDYARAAEEYLITIEVGSDSRLVEQARSRLITLIAEELTSGEIERLHRRYPDSTLLAEGATPKLSRLTIGVLAPLTGDFSDAGQEMVQGIRLAVRYSNLTNVDLVIEDSAGDPIQAVIATQQLTNQESVQAIIGPVRSETTVGAAAVANCQAVPLITPTAAETGIADIGSYIFQLHVTPSIQGAAVAEYAIEHLGLRRFAVLAVSDPYGKDLATGFVLKTEQLGGTVLSHEWYYEGATDFGPQLNHIRDAGLDLEQADSSAWEWKLFQLKTSGLIDTTAEELFPPVDSIDGFFLAAYPEDIPLLASQIAYQKIRTQLLGGSSWNSDEVLRNGGQYVEGAIFAADFFEGNLSEDYLTFVDRYRQRYGQTSTKVAALSYDAAMLLLDNFSRGSKSRKKLRDLLAETRNARGTTGIITFPAGKRSNTHVVFLTIRNGEIAEIQ
ncbi:MAG: penicillin-binding protein activator [Gemmatimonadota bacterium]|nr:MAG: penicillin-binding protein activator [Gemmatimonadota bacterium]